MRTSWNVALQVGAVVACVGLRSTAPGWFLFILIITIVGALFPLIPTVLSLFLLRRRTLPASLAAPFVACAGFLVLGGLTVPDFDDVRTHAPVMVLLGQGDAPVPDAVHGLAMLSVLGWLAALVWLVVALVLVNRPSRRPAGPGHPAWGRAPDAG